MVVFKSVVCSRISKCFFGSKVMIKEIPVISEATSAVEYHLSQHERTFYKKFGYIVIRGLFQSATLDNIRNLFLKIISSEKMNQRMTIIREKNLISAKKRPEDYINKIQDVLHDEVFMAYSEDPRLLHIVSQFIGEELTALNSMVINKPPGSTRHPPHQDLYYFPLRPAHIIGSWTAIDPSTFDNGCLYCVPASHKQEILPHGAFQDSKKFFHVLVNEDIHAPKHKRLYLELNPGDTVFFHPCLIHGSEANLSKNYRKSVAVHYMNSDCKYVDFTGTVQESVLRDFEKNIQKNGFPKTYEELWRLKSKIVKGVQ